MELNFFAICQKDGEFLKDYLHQFNIVDLELASATQEVKANAFSQELLDEDFFIGQNTHLKIQSRLN
ncbi:UNVERIFIED_CONTAM: hypothetical protein Sradi_2678100 [Sesamum radiatum]|uniref:Uncharacterized protein n=1 Tax=Sesamum radiatum TaxID=300843 RepID=A0AAW2S8H8_SESRA